MSTKPGLIHFHVHDRHIRRLLVLLIGFELVLAVCYGMVHGLEQRVSWGPIWHLVNVDGEASLPAWFSGLQLFMVGALLLVIARRDTATRWFLTLLGAAFVFLSADEIASVHEQFNEYAHRGEFGWITSLGFDGDGAWVIPYLAAGLVVLLLGLRPVLSLWRRYRSASMWVAAGFAVMVVAVGLEVVSYSLRDDPSLRMLYILEAAAEEFCEMLGVSLILFGVSRLGLGLATEPVAVDAVAVDDAAESHAAVSLPPRAVRRDRPLVRPTA